MAQRKVKLSRGGLFVAFLALGVVSLLVPQRFTKGLNFLFARVFNSVLNVGGGLGGREFCPVLPTDGPADGADYNKLWTMYYNLQTDLKLLQDQYAQVARIQAGSARPGVGCVPAQVRNISKNAYRHELFINRGRADGVKTGQYVLGENGGKTGGLKVDESILGEYCVIGTISETGATDARVRLITDATHKIEVGLCHSQGAEYLRKQMVGDGKNACKIPLVSREYDVRTGDIVYATAAADFLDVSRVIGVVRYVQSDENQPLLLDITVEPVYKAETLVDVAVIIMDPKKIKN